MPYRDGLGDRPLRNLHQHTREESDDIEKAISSAKGKDSINSVDIDTQEVSEYTSPLPLETPFFHIDLQSAVRAAESGLASR